MLGDTHLPRGSRALPERCLEILQSAALIVHTGDFTAASVLEELEAIGPPVCSVHGNMDDGDLRESLPQRRVVAHGGLTIGLVHDAGARPGRHARLRAAFPTCGLIAYGHTHAPEISHFEDTWIVNPGSPTDRRRSARHTMAVVKGGVPRLVQL